MHIDRSNYEIWLIDWLDGNLNSLQIEQLKLYLEQNPDIREEFNDLAAMNLVPGQVLFPHKDQLKRSASDISGSQFEYLCTAYLENDLTDSQKAELSDIVSIYPDRKKTFDLIQKTILFRERNEYKYKGLLRKRTTFQNVIWLTVAGLSTAAAIFFIIIVFSGINGNTAIKINTSANNNVPDSILQRPSSVLATERMLKDNIADPVEEKSENRVVNSDKKIKVCANKIILAATDEFVIRKAENQRMMVNKVPVHPQVDLIKGITSDTIIALNPTIIISEADNERSKAGKFISKTFRQKFLKEKTPPDSPLKGYEIAEAGITGLNKLFGWQMVLDMKNDDNGQPSSVCFSSKILKLNAPVKKKEAQQ